MTRMTKKKEASDKDGKVTKAKPSGIRSKKTSAKTEVSISKVKKLESSKPLKEEKKLKKETSKKIKEVKEVKIVSPKKEKAEKKEPIKAPSKKAVKSIKKVSEIQPQETLFPEINIKTNLFETKTLILNHDLDTPVPQYTIPDKPDDFKKSVKFENIIANSIIIESLKNAGYIEPNEVLQKALPATLRGSDVLLLKTIDHNECLIGVITAASRLLSESLSRGSIKTPSILFVNSSQSKVDEVFHICSPIFESLGISVLKLDEKTKKEELENQFLDKPFDIIIGTPKILKEALHSHSIKLKNVGLYLLSESQNFSLDESSADLEKILKELSQERVQKIICANENSPYVREFAFKYLEDPEYISILPFQIRERSPKQFAHALQATQKFQVLLGHLKTHKPACAVVFANTVPVAEWLAFKLNGNGIKVELVTSQLNLHKKQLLLKSIKSEEINVIVTIDSVSKFLGIRELNCIYNFDLPDLAKNFINRLSKIEGTKHPIAVSFICEDYGFNIKNIETELGFKIHIAKPDRNYFNIKDTSDYPLEASGKVKQIGVVYEDNQVVSTISETPQKVEIAAKEPQQKVVKKYEIESISSKVIAPPQVAASAINTKLQPRSDVESKDESEAMRFQSAKYSLKSNDVRKSTHQQTNRSHYDSVNRDNKFVRRDERAKEAIEGAKQASKAAHEKRKERYSYNTGAQPKRPGLIKIMVSLVQDAIQSAAVAAKDSVATNIHENLPVLSNVLERFNILKKPSKIQEDNKK